MKLSHMMEISQVGREKSMASGQETILVVTNDETFGRAVEKHLTQNGYETIVAADSVSALEVVHRVSPTLVIVDRRQLLITAPLRRDSVLRSVPFIAVHPPGSDCSAEECLNDLDQDVDMVLCDQSYRQLIARVRAVLRRENLQMIPRAHYIVGELRLDVERHEVTVGDRQVELTPKEFLILRQLMISPSRVFSREELLNRVWGEHVALEEHTLDVHIHSLRHKIERDPTHPRYILTIRGVGYKLQSN
jgi:two-component system response regulator RegX3